MNPQPSNRDVTQPRPKPNSKWTCGHQELGFACPHGPTQDGKCSHSPRTKSPAGNDVASDQPTAADPCSACTQVCANRVTADAASCESQSAGCDGCEHPEMGPCIPFRAAWHFRYTFALNTAILTGGLLLLLMTIPQREAIFVPGGLSRKHAQILENKLVSERCSLCHPNAHTLNESGVMLTQDELCTRCHESHLPNLHLRSPHDMDRDHLKQLTLKKVIQLDQLVSYQGRKQADAVAHLIDYTSISPSDTQPIRTASNPDSESAVAETNSAELTTNCASCHIEHHGRSHDLQAITDRRCQACHVKQFESFANGHPEFTDYPQSRPRRIAFTHQAHHDKHFAKKNEKFDCASCHLDTKQVGGVGSIFRTLSFETACARCHAEPIQAATVDAWTILQLPSIQPEDVRKSSLGLSDWPENAQFGYEGNVPLAMRSLLMADSTLTATLEQLPASGDLKKLPDFATAGPEATRNVAGATRRLIQEVAAGGQAAWRKRLETVATHAVQRPLNSSEQRLLDDLCAGLPPDIFRQMESAWFNNTNSLAGSSITLPAQLVTANLTATQDDDLLLGGEENASSENDLLDASPNAESEPPMESKLAPDADELLNSDADSLLMGNDTQEQAAAPEADAANLLLEAAPADTPHDRAPAKPKFTKFRGAVHVVQGGWYLDHETLALRYMPRGHADRTLAAWVEFAVLIGSRKPSNQQVVSTPTAPEHAAALASLVPGGCTQCHQLDSISSAAFSAWKGYSQPVTERRITKFDHTPHLTLPTLANCKYCHEFNRDQAVPSTVSVLVSTVVNTVQSPTVTASPVTNPCEFKSLRLEQCNACHRPQGANAGCVQCHNYHVTTPH